MSEWTSKNFPGQKSRKPEYPDLTENIVDPTTDNNIYHGNNSLVGWYRFLGDGPIGRVDGGTTNTFPNMALTGSSGQTLTTSGSLGSAVYYEEGLYGAAVTYKPRIQSAFDPVKGIAKLSGTPQPSGLWQYSFNEQVTPYLPSNKMMGAMPFSGSKAEKNYFRITDTDNWNIYSSGAEFSVAVWVRMNDYQAMQQGGDTRMPIITKIKQGTDWADGGEFAMTWLPSSITECNIRMYLQDDSGNDAYGRSGYFNANLAANEMNDSSYPEPLAEIPPNGSWVHLVMTWNGTNTDSGTNKPRSDSTDGIKTYINGHFVMYDNVMGSFDGDIRPATDSTCGDILIGSGRDDNAPTNTGKYTNQDIAEAAFWSRALSPREIKALYHAQTVGMKKYDTGLVKNPPRPQLQRLDATAGSAYPTTAGSADQYRLGKRTPYFDDTLTRVFVSSSARSAGTIQMGSRLPVNTRLLSASFSTPNKPPTLEVSVAERSSTPGQVDADGNAVPTWGIDARVMGNLPFLTASVTEFKDPIKPYNDSRFYIDSSLPFFQTGSVIIPSFDTPLKNKAQIVIPLNTTGSARFGIQSDRRSEQWFMGYWNPKARAWNKVGRGLLSPTYPQINKIDTVAGASTGSTFHAPYSDTAAPGYNAGNSAPVPYQYEGVVQRNVNFASCGFSPLACHLPIGWQVPVDLGGDGSFVEINHSEFIGQGRPITTYGFPFDARYQASDDQCIKMSDYIDAPFLLEKIVIFCSASFEIGGDEGDAYRGQNELCRWRSLYQLSGGSFYNARGKQWGYAASFFLLRQRKGKFDYESIETHGSNFGGGGIKVDLGTKLTSSIPGYRCINQDGENNQTIFVSSSDTRDLITYSQIAIAGTEGGQSSISTDAQTIFDAGAGRNYSIEIDDRSSATVQKGNNWIYSAQGQITGSFVLTSSCITTPVDRYGKMRAAPIAAGNTGATLMSLRNLLGGRMNPQNQLSDRRALIKGIASGLSSSAGWLDFGTSGAYPSGFALSATGSAKSTWIDTESPYILMPGDKLVFGVQGDVPNKISRIGWPSMLINNGNSTQDFWDNSKPGMNIEMLPDPNARIVFYGSYIKDHKVYYGSMNQQLTTPGVHGVVSDGPVLDQWEIDCKEEYSGSYLDESITGSMTYPPHGWPRGPAATRVSIWASASATPTPGAGSPGDGSFVGLKPYAGANIKSPGYADTGGPFDGSIKPWVSASAYHSSSVYGRYFSTNRIYGTGQNWMGAEGGIPSQPTGLEPASTREVAGTAFNGSAGDVFGFQRNVRLNCEEETYYDSLVPDPAVCWAADNQPLGYAGGVIAANIEKDGNVELGIGASNAGTHAGKELPTDSGDSYAEYPDWTTPGTEDTFYTNEWWLASFPFEARYRGFTEPPTDEYKRRTKIYDKFQVRLCSPYFDQEEPWNGFCGLAGSTSSYGTDHDPAVVAQSAGCKGVVTMYVNGKKPGLQRSLSAYTTPSILGFTTSVDDVDGTVLPVLFGFGRGISGSVAPWKRTAGTDANSAAGDNDPYDGSYKYISNKPSGCKYGLYSWKPRLTSTIFRSTKFGQFRDMLEQRRYTRFFLKADGAVEISAPIFCQFKEPAWLAPTDDTDKKAASTQCSNLSTFATSSVPYFDGEVKNRGPLIADGSDTIVIE